MSTKTFTRLMGAATVCAAVAGSMAYAQNSDPNMPAASAPANTQPNDQRFNTGSNGTSSTTSNTTPSSNYNTDGTQAPRTDRH